MKNYLILSICLFVLSGCTHKYFYPTTPNVPMHQSAGELTLSGDYTFSDNFDGGEAQAAYSVSNHIGITGNFIYVRGEENKINNYGYGKMGEIGLGYFTNNNHLHFSFYGGGGLGDQAHKYPTDSINFSLAEMDFVRLYLQPSLGLSYKYFETAFTTRFSMVNYNNVQANINPVDDPYNYDIVSLLDKEKPYWFFEPALMIRFGPERIKFQTNLGLMYELRDKGVFVRSALSAGIHVRLGGKL